MFSEKTEIKPLSRAGGYIKTAACRLTYLKTHLANDTDTIRVFMDNDDSNTLLILGNAGAHDIQATYVEQLCSPFTKPCQLKGLVTACQP